MERLICIAGKNNIAIDVAEYLRSNYPDIPLCAITDLTDDGQNKFQYSFKTYAKNRGIRITCLEDIYAKENLIFLSIEFDRIVKPKLFRSKELYNIHFSLLPKYKGMYTSSLPILHGEAFTGVTFHRIDSGIDTGEIVAQRVVPILEEDTSKSLYLKLIQQGTQLVISCLPDVIAGTVHSFPQGVVGSTYFSKRTLDYKNLFIDFHATAQQVSNQIRAFHFRDYQMPIVEGRAIQRVIFTQEASMGNKPGTILEVSPITMKVATIDYNIILVKDELDDLLLAAKTGDLDCLRQCEHLRYYVNEAEITHGWTLLMVAGYAGNQSICNYLLSQGADINSSNFNGTTFIMYVKDACLKSGNPQMLFDYIERGANPYQYDVYGKHLIHYLKEQNPFWIDRILNMV